MRKSQFDRVKQGTVPCITLFKNLFSYSEEKGLSITTGGIVSIVSAFDNRESGRYTTEQAWIAALVGIATTILSVFLPANFKIALGMDIYSFASGLVLDSIFNFINGHLWGYDEKKS